MYVRKFGPGMAQELRNPNNMLNRRAKAMMANVKDDPRPIAFVYHEGSRVFNTLRCHLLSEALADDIEKQNLVQEIMFRRYFVEGKDLGQIEELRAVGKEAGLGEDFVDAAIAENNAALREKVRNHLLMTQKRGVHGVPFMIFQPTREQVSGGLPPEEFEEILARCVEGLS